MLTVYRMGLFLASVIMPNQWPRFFSRERSEKLAAALSDVNRTCELMERDVLKLDGKKSMINSKRVKKLFSFEGFKKNVLP